MRICSRSSGSPALSRSRESFRVGPDSIVTGARLGRAADRTSILAVLNDAFSGANSRFALSASLLGSQCGAVGVHRAQLRYDREFPEGAFADAVLVRNLNSDGAGHKRRGLLAVAGV